MMTRDGLKVTGASLLGFGAPSVNWIVEVGEPVLKLLLLLAQFGVAVATIFYISRKWKQAGKKPRRIRKRPLNLDED